MPQILIGIFSWAMGSLLSRVLVGAGLAVVTYQGVSTLTNNFLSAVSTNLGGLPADMTAILAIAGFGVAISVILSTAASVAAVALASRVAGVKRK